MTRYIDFDTIRLEVIIMNRNNNGTKKELEKYLESDKSEDYRDLNFAYLMLDLDFGSTPTWEEALNQDKWFSVPYWLEKYSDDEYLAEYMPGYYEPLLIGVKKQYEDKEYELIDSHPLSEEIEHQAENGELAYEYRGYSFIRIWKQVKSPQ